MSSRSVLTRSWHFAQRKQSMCQSCVLRAGCEWGIGWGLVKEDERW